ncbi:MAG: hypothetical protein JNN03_07130 [Rubrivivax sp.]|nr:hypothetical protein [Rubrivivax sp.]
MTLGACATSPAGLPAGKFVTLQCADNKSFQARMSDDGRTVRVRGHHGSAELEQRGEGRYSGDGYMLNLQAEGGVALEHDGKSQGKACKAAV